MEFIIGFLILLFIVLTILLFYKRNTFLAKKQSLSAKPNHISNDTYLSEEQIPWEVSAINKNEIQTFNQQTPVVLTNQLKNHVEEIIKITPAASDLVRTEKKVIIKFKKEVMDKLNNGELTIARKKGSIDEFRTIAVDNKGKIRAHGWAESKNIKKINPTQLANVAFGVMTIVTSQEHLDKINKQLNLMDKKIDSLLRKYTNDKLGFINGNIRYLKSILPSIVAQDHLSNAYLIKIEDISSEAYTQLESVFIELNTLINEISNFKNTKFKIDENIEGVKDLYLTFEEQLLIGYGSLELISVCLKLVNDSNSHNEVSRNKLSDIEDFYIKLDELNSNFESLISKKTLELDATFRRQKTIQIKKEAITEQYLYHREIIESHQSTNQQHINQLKMVNSIPLDEPLDLQIEYDKNNNLIAAYRN
ncbi:hypothetical protein [Alkalicoccus saliphilus]|uniref:Uncharacterized protein n=1 Tax=Alkalicoccus saliphilus TaxID=200989 RepID=A0A2T4U3V8_9BACI|nr:hypothetical protein [Alkalicoccus saliphilus]PTL38091.1 hypothetical protein C6Y45_12915 [Alkalicoccus saliphilus]